MDTNEKTKYDVLLNDFEDRMSHANINISTAVSLGATFFARVCCNAGMDISDAEWEKMFSQLMKKKVALQFKMGIKNESQHNRK